MSTRYASGKRAIAECDRCGFQYKLKQLKKLTIKGVQTSIKVCPTCWEPDQPQNMTGMYPVDDPQALRDPRPDTGVDASRAMFWGWDPVGLNDPLGLVGLSNTLKAESGVGTVTVTTE